MFLSSPWHADGFRKKVFDPKSHLIAADVAAHEVGDGMEEGGGREEFRLLQDVALFVIGFKKEFKYTVVFVEREVRKGDNHLNKE